MTQVRIMRIILEGAGPSMKEVANLLEAFVAKSKPSLYLKEYGGNPYDLNFDEDDRNRVYVQILMTSEIDKKEMQDALRTFLMNGGYRIVDSIDIENVSEDESEVVHLFQQTSGGEIQRPLKPERPDFREIDYPNA
ncbi:hypothetical protein [Desulfomonile tiedjei]|uniref:Uncharacterized protein n=1 Tax=Desulfomonile tiedjei (strain ATCC 49306 / DSM 6799 / DCB-1) TaxID=706587 RepID=I4C2J7_DESTA|nr:hypothetical protein [Desulfomonile tiedjei]AFM23788.1 hypothetical protein Desti_1074 [Desulfomonile tiedjei DSM 6799]